MRSIHVLSTALVLAATIGSVAQAQGDQGRGRGRGRGDDKDRQAPPAEQQQRIKEEQRRTDDYRRHLDDQMRAAQAQAAQLQTARRTAQYRAQQEYAEQLARQQEALRAERRYDVEPYITAPRIYRYRFNDGYRETNQYGADLLRQAVNDGYRRGYRAGVADREDRWRADYANSPEYRDGTYGYAGSYVDLDDYAYYFRQGFRRGYDDGYYSRFRYGSGSSGTVSILAGVLGGILGLTIIR